MSEFFNLLLSLVPLLSVICAMIAVYYTYKNVKLWRSQMMLTACFPSLSDVLGKLTAFEDLFSRFFSIIEETLPQWLDGSISDKEFGKLVKDIADEKQPYGAFRSGGQMVELVFGDIFNNQVSVDLISDVKQLINPVRSIKVDVSKDIKSLLWDLVETQTKLNRRMTKIELAEALSLGEDLYTKKNNYYNKIERIRQMATACVSKLRE